jgi:hypothetical protein
MQFTVLAASIKRGLGEHGTAIRLFGSALGLLIAGQLCYRKALLSATQHNLESLWQVSQSFWGMLGIGLILLSLIPWLALRGGLAAACRGKPSPESAWFC